MLRTHTRMCTVVLVMLLTVSLIAGCTWWQVAASSLAGFGAGWVGNVYGGPTQTETTCYQNGVEVDCGSLPDDVQ